MLRSSLLTVALFTSTVLAQLVPHLFHPADIESKGEFEPHFEYLPFEQHQQPIMPADDKEKTMLSDLISIDKSLSIFGDLCRQYTHIEHLLEDPLAHITLIVPNNNAFTSLARKPWDTPSEPEIHITEDIDADRKRSFIERHLVLDDELLAGKRYHTIGGEVEVFFEEKEGVRKLFPGELKVLKVETAGNGVLWVVDGVVEAK
ncbi:hypothetical protein SAICODRAFT_5482 [Saitoella complicata NRRL Y-17804]|nr:uncharacterized protein SAICODRAFT_5482 [Saitoella complicata NRRL Y-17804]ODQ55545.1 hypothetical protein SAICODRAFT_5482 [Saitoella complicata NRRL Y-17804]